MTASPAAVAASSAAPLGSAAWTMSKVVMSKVLQSKVLADPSAPPSPPSAAANRAAQPWAPAAPGPCNYNVLAYSCSRDYQQGLQL